jgi:riboflavin biosynthesis pyrimidine reductase
MEQINTLLDRSKAQDQPVLPEELKILYGGDLRFPALDVRPYVIGNFVSTIDGVVSFEIPGESGGGDISGFNEADRFIMGLLRASVDAVIVGAGTLREVAPGHLWLAAYVYPEASELYARYRQRVLNKLVPPLNVIVSGSGAVDLQRAAFRTGAVKTLIVTSPKGAELLVKNGVAALTSAEVRAIEGKEGKIAPASILKLLRDEFGMKILLHEGGPALFGDFVVHGCVDELFLTVAPRFAGRDAKRQRPGIVAGADFLPQTAPWLKLLSVKQSSALLTGSIAERPHAPLPAKR